MSCARGYASPKEGTEGGERAEFAVEGPSVKLEHNSRSTKESQRRNAATALKQLEVNGSGLRGGVGRDTRLQSDAGFGAYKETTG